MSKPLISTSTPANSPKSSDIDEPDRTVSDVWKMLL